MGSLGNYVKLLTDGQRKWRFLSRSDFLSGHLKSIYSKVAITKKS